MPKRKFALSDESLKSNNPSDAVSSDPLEEEPTETASDSIDAAEIKVASTFGTATDKDFDFNEDSDVSLEDSGNSEPKDEKDIGDEYDDDDSDKDIDYDDDEYDDDDSLEGDVEAAFSEELNGSIEQPGAADDEDEYDKYRISDNPYSANSPLRYERANAEEIGLFSSDRMQETIISKANRLQRIRRNKKVVFGTILSEFRFKKNQMTEQISNLLKKSSALLLDVQIEGYEEFQFILPFRELDLYVGSRWRGPSTKLEIKKYIENIIGARIAVTITDHIRGSKYWILSRKEANRILRKRYYYSGYKRRMTDDGYKDMIIANGTTVHANVFEVKGGSLVLDAFGAQFTVSARGLTSLRSENFKKTYKPGNTVKLKLLEIKKLQDSDYNVEILQAVSTDMDNTREALENAYYTHSYSAIITGTTFNGGSYVGHTLGSTGTRFNIVTNIVPNGVVLKSGCIVKVRLIKKIFDHSHNSYYASVDVLGVLKQ